MHLLATEPGMIADGSAAVDLAQTPGDIVMLASADTEIALLAAAQARRRDDDPAAPTLRLAPVMRLVETCREHGIPMALLPGDDKPDAELAQLSTVPRDAWHRLWRYLAEGGPGNADNFLRYASALLDNPTQESHHGDRAPHPNPL